jgi:DNA-binding IclR family transcriptional regulator
VSAGEPAGEGSRYFIQSVEATLKVAECFLESGEPALELREISGMTGYNKNRVFRILSTLVDLGYVWKREDGTGYSLGAGFLLLGERVRDHANLRDLGEPYLIEMVEATNDAAHIYALLGQELVCIEHRVGSYMVQAAGLIGERIPLHVGPAKVVLASMNEDEIAAYLSGVTLEPFTEKTVIDREALGEQLALIKSQGYWVDHEEFEIGCHAVATAVRDHRGRPTAACILAIPSARYSLDRETRAIQLTSRAASELSGQLGFQN